MPTLYCPFEPAINPHTEAAAEGTRRWAARFDWVASDSKRLQLASEKFTHLVGRFFPQARHCELQWISDYTSWLFWHDDVCDETDLGRQPALLAEQFQQLNAVLLGHAGARPGDPFDAALIDMRERLCDLAPGVGWLSRWLANAADYFEACVWEARNRACASLPEVELYVPLRRCSSGMWMYLNFLELVLGEELPIAFRQDPDIRRLAQMTANVAAWHNDLFSMDKELSQKDMHNLVLVLNGKLEQPSRVAMLEAAQRADEEVRAFVALSRQVASRHATPGLAAYLGGLEHLMRGNLDWSLESGRYGTAPDQLAG